MLEILIATMILALLLAVAVPSLATTGRTAPLRQSAREILALTRWARATAVFGEIEIELRISPDDGRYQLWYDTEELVRREALRTDRRGRNRAAERQLEQRVEDQASDWLQVRSLPSDSQGPVVVFDAVETEIEVQSRQSRRSTLPAIIFSPDGTATGGTIILRSRTGAAMSLQMYTATGIASLTEGDIREEEQAEQGQEAGT